MTFNTILEIFTLITTKSTQIFIKFYFNTKTEKLLKIIITKQTRCMVLTAFSKNNPVMSKALKPNLIVVAIRLEATAGCCYKRVKSSLKRVLIFQLCSYHTL